jgi:hypothetical protein
MILQPYVRIFQREIFELENVLFNDNEQFLVDIFRGYEEGW